MPSNLAAILPEAKAQLVVQEVPYPTAGPGEIILKVESAALNPAEFKIQRYANALPVQYPVVLGFDAAGTVEAVGADVTKFQPGDRVATFTNLGGYTRYLAVDAGLAIKIGDLSFDAASTYPVCYLTAYGALVPHLGLPTAAGGNPGKVLVAGGASPTGMFAIQYAAHVGATVVATASPHNFEFVKKLGASTVVDYNAASAAAELKAAGPYAAVFDAVGISGKLLRDVVEDGQKVATTTPDVQNAWAGKDAEVVFKSFPFEVTADPALRKQAVSTLQEMVASGKLLPAPPVVRKGGLKGLQKALDELADKGVSAGKIVVRPWEE